MQLRTATPEEVAAWRDTFESDNPNCGGAESDTQDEYLSAIALQTPLGVIACYTTRDDSDHYVALEGASISDPLLFVNMRAQLPFDPN